MRRTNHQPDDTRFGHRLAWSALTLCLLVTIPAVFAYFSAARQEGGNAGLSKLVENVRLWQAKQPPFPPQLTDITEALYQEKLVPPGLLLDDGPASPWGAAVRVGLNMGGAMPLIDITIPGLSRADCAALVEAASRRYSSRRDLWQIWLTPQGVVLNSFPVTDASNACSADITEAHFQFRLKKRAF